MKYLLEECKISIKFKAEFLRIKGSKWSYNKGILNHFNKGINHVE